MVVVDPVALCVLCEEILRLLSAGLSIRDRGGSSEDGMVSDRVPAGGSPVRNCPGRRR